MPAIEQGKVTKKEAGAGIGALIVIALLVFAFVKKKKASLWKVGDVVWCYAGGDSGSFTIIDKRFSKGSWEYRVGEGSPVIEDLGWWGEKALVASPWGCHYKGA
ncbi:hypothetical protein ES708_00776 [subsurface metagenome]